MRLLVDYPVVTWTYCRHPDQVGVPPGRN